MGRSESSETWNKRCAQLREYVDAKGTARVPTTYRARDGFRLDIWVVKQRFLHRHKRLAAWKVRALEAVRSWEWNPPRPDTWPRRYEILRKHVESTGTARVPNKYRMRDRYQLGVWVAKQRRLHRTGKLGLLKVKALEALPGWVWDPKPLPKGSWERGMARLREFVERNGTSRMSARHATSDGFRLGLWVIKQRGFFRRGRLTPEQVSVLKAMPGWDWDPPRHGTLTKEMEAIWERNCGYLREYVQKNGTSRVPHDYVTPEGSRLGVWVHVQRDRYRARKILPHRARALEKLTDWVWRLGAPGPRRAPWKAGLSHLETFVKKHGTSLVPAAYEDRDGYRLGAWVASQRVLFRSGKLPSDRISALQALPGWLWYPSKRL